MAVIYIALKNAREQMSGKISRDLAARFVLNTIDLSILMDEGWECFEIGDLKQIEKVETTVLERN